MCMRSLNQPYRILSILPLMDIWVASKLTLLTVIAQTFLSMSLYVCVKCLQNGRCWVGKYNTFTYTTAYKIIFPNGQSQLPPEEQCTIFPVLQIFLNPGDFTFFCQSTGHQTVFWYLSFCVSEFVTVCVNGSQINIFHFPILKVFYIFEFHIRLC